jgi:ubiquinone/menaquinone biosynthesis C-methylase UbiE
MALEHPELAGWATSLLELWPDDRVLEVGFGPGTAIQLMSQLAYRGFVAGVDLSAVMVRQASARNAAAIRQGRVELREGSATALPYGDARFGKALAINSVDHWSSPAGGLKELWRVLQPGGLACIVDRPHGAKGEEAVARAGEEMLGLVRSAGFAGVRTVAGLKGTAVGVLGTK